MLTLFAILLLQTSDARPPIATQDLPPELAGWTDWVRWEHPEWDCPLLAGTPTCVWPGQLDVSAGAGSASLQLRVHLDADGVVVLPGGAGLWPDGLRVDGRPHPVLSAGELPSVDLSTGDHVVSWTVPWATRPTALPLGPGVGIVHLTVDGAEVPFPLVDGDGRLRLGMVEQEGPADNRVELEVFRRVYDGVPVLLTTQLNLAVAGQPRELDLGAILPEGLQPVAVQANLPARITPEGTLVVQVRPGRFEVTVDAVSSAPVMSLAPPVLAAPWPDEEVWSFTANDRVRTVNLSGPVGVDPARTSMPEAWRALPAYVVTPTTPLLVEELRRGEPEPPVNAISLTRELWLDLDGRGWTVRDTFHGQQSRDWRFDVQAPLLLGHVVDDGTDQVVTSQEGRQGVEVRSTQVRVTGESRVDGAVRTLPAVGWDVDVQQLEGALRVPPGWTLVWASGVDEVIGLVPWSLFDLFFVLVLSLGFGRVLGWRWGALALLSLGLSRHSEGAPNAAWVVLLVLIAVESVVPEGRLSRVIKGTRWATLIVLFGTLAVFAVGQIRSGVFPQLEDGSWRGSSAAYPTAYPTAYDELQEAEEVGYDADVADGAREMKVVGGLRAASSPARSDKKQDLGYLAKQTDPAAVVQTGPGVPTWSWTEYTLRWSGPVGSEPTMTLWLLPPLAGLGLVLVRLGFLLMLALRLAGLGLAVGGRQAAATAAAALVVLTVLPGVAEAAPDAAQLEELARRLHPAPDCAERCAEASSSVWTVSGDLLTMQVVVDARTDTTWPLPGPASTWVPARVLIDGNTTTRLRRHPDGAVHVGVPEGVHTLTVEGRLPPTDVLALQLLVPPHRLVFRGDGWTVEGLKADGTVGSTVQLVRAQPVASGRPATSAENLTPWVEVHRTLDLGIPWRIRTEVKRVGAAAQPLALRVPLLPGESVTDDDLLVEDGVAIVTLPRDGTSRSWTSSLDLVPELVLTAPEGVAWTEVWTLSCSPIFTCSTEGPAPISHVQDGRWSPVWRPWPGESLTLTAARPDAVTGQTTTVDAATLRWTPGVRLAEAELELSIRSSQGGPLTLTLPEGASLRAVRLGGVERPLQLRDDGTLVLPLQPGNQPATVSWQQPHEQGAIDTVPEVRVNAAVVNATVEINQPRTRWILALTGPDWGPVPLFWLYLGQVLVASLLLARLPWAPLSAPQWFLLGLGMTQVPVVVPILVVLAFLALGARRDQRVSSWWAFDLLQVTLVGTTAAAIGLLYWAVHAGLLIQPDMQVEGNGSSDGFLRWYVDRTDGLLPTPTVVSLPLWSFRVLMLLWSLWLAYSLVGWARWAWGCWTEGGFWRGPGEVETVPSGDPPGPSD